MAIETDMLTSLMSGSQQSNANASPFNFGQSLPTHSFDYGMTSPNLDHGMDLTSSAHPGFHPSALFNNFKFGNEHPEPPITLPASAPAFSNSTDHRSRSQSSSRSSNIGKVPSSRARPSRKLSMNDARPPVSSIQQRGRSTQPSVLGLGLDTHKEGEKTNSVSPPEFGYSPYGISIPHHLSQNGWPNSGSLPSIVAGSFGTTVDEGVLDSPVTPAHALPHLPPDDMNKKQRRRECHNQVEKRRREHINAKIEELSQLVPAQYGNVGGDVADDDEDDEANNEGGVMKKKKTKRANSTTKQQKDSVQCKGRILTQSVQYIRDLKRLSDFQASRIAQLEAMLSASNPQFQPTSIPLQPASVFWSSVDGTQNNGFPYSHNLGSLNETHLEVMRQSPEPDRLISLDQLGLNNWGSNFHQNGDPQNNVLMSFEPSPTDVSPSSANAHRRSSSLSSSAHSSEEDSKEGLLSVKKYVSDGLTNNGQIAGNDGKIEMRGRQMERTIRKDSQPELQASMSGMDLDTMFAHRREEDHGGMRW